MPDKCPYCDYVAASVAHEIAHMETVHPEIIRERLEKAGMSPSTSWHGSRPPEENHIVIALIRERDEARKENTRLRELYENVVGNRKRFGWTIDHLLECDEALRCVEAENGRLREERQAALDCINLYGDETLHKALDGIGWPRENGAI